MGESELDTASLEVLAIASLEELAMESVSDTASLEVSAMGLLATVLSVTVSATALLEESAMESESDTVSLEESATELALEECTTEPPSSTLPSPVKYLELSKNGIKKILIGHKLPKLDSNLISILSIEINITLTKKKS